jgi:hypothetical protein
MCSSCEDYTYEGTSGCWERLDPVFGRVGSAFTPEVGNYVCDTCVEPELGPLDESNSAGEPTPADDPAPEPPAEKEPMAAETSVLQNRNTMAR